MTTDHVMHSKQIVRQLSFMNTQRYFGLSLIQQPEAQSTSFADRCKFIYGVRVPLEIMDWLWCLCACKYGVRVCAPQDDAALTIITYIEQKNNFTLNTFMHRNTNALFICHFPDTPGLAGCPFDFHSPLSCASSQTGQSVFYHPCPIGSSLNVPIIT